MRSPPLLPLVIPLALLCACSDDGASAYDNMSSDAGYAFRDAGGAPPYSRGECYEDLDCPLTDVCFDGVCVYQGQPTPPADAGLVDAAPRPPEQEETFEVFGAPAAGQRYVWIVSPDTDSVVRIDGETRAIKLVEVGDTPTLVEGLPGSDEVMVLAWGSDEVLRVRPEEGRGEVTRYPLTFHANALSVDPAGRRAFAWFDLARALPGEDASALQQVAVIDLADDTMEVAVVGYRPSRIEFTPEGAALVITDDGLSVLAPELEAGPSPIVPLAPSFGDFGAREVVLSPDARHAASWAAGEGGVTLVDLAEGAPRFIPLGALPTDLEPLPDGRMLVMLPSIDQLALIPFDLPPEALDDPAALDEAITRVSLRGAYLGAAAVSPSGRRALLYTTTAPLDGPGVIGLLAPEAEALILTPLRKAARGAALDPTGRVAVVLHGRAAGAPALDDPEAIVRHSYGYSLVNLDTGFVKLELTPAEPSGLVFAADQGAAFLRLSSADDPDAASPVAAATRVDLVGLSTRTWSVGSPPEVIGVLEALDRAFVTQTHPTGRISFLRLDDPEAPIETVTGYALNGRIE